MTPAPRRYHWDAATRTLSRCAGSRTVAFGFCPGTTPAYWVLRDCLWSAPGAISRAIPQELYRAFRREVWDGWDWLREPWMAGEGVRNWVAGVREKWRGVAPQN